MEMLSSRLELSRATVSEFTFPSARGKTFLPYQEAGIEYCLYNPYINALIADEPGLGKTMQALGIMNYFDKFPVLIICPASLLDNWVKEIEAWSPRKLDIQVIRRGKDTIRNADVLVLSFNLVTNLIVFKRLCTMAFALLIIDEVHFLKGPTSQRTKAILGNIEAPSMRGIFRKAKYTIALSGTPLPNRPLEIYVIAKALCPECLLENGVFMTYEQFAIKFNGAYYQGKHLILGTPSKKNLRDLGKRLRSTFMVRRLKKHVLKMLPAKREQLIYLNRESKEICDLIDRMAVFDISEVGSSKFESTYKGLSEMRKDLGVLKLGHAVDFIKTQLESGHEKIVVFAHHKDVIAGLEEALAQYGVCKIDGSVPNHKRQAEVDKFQGGPERIFIGSIKASGVGHTLTRAFYVVFVEFMWVPGENDQAIDRVHRIGQNDSVLADFLVYEGSLDEIILKTHFKKKAVINEVLEVS